MALMLVGAALIMAFSRTCMDAALSSARVFVTAVMPSLFPMMALCGLYAPRVGGARGGKIPSRLFGVSGEGAGIMLFSLLSGSPASSRMLGACENRLPECEITRLSAYCGVMSPLFFTGTLDTWLGGSESCALILACHWLSAVIVGEASRLFFRDGGKKPEREGRAPRPAPTLGGALSQAGSGLMAVCGAMMLSGALCALILEGLSMLGITPSPKAAAILASLMEIGGGADMMCALNAPDAPLICGLCGFGGLSLYLQNLAFLGDSVRPLRLLIIRLAHGLTSYALYSVIQLLPL